MQTINVPLILLSLGKKSKRSTTSSKVRNYLEFSFRENLGGYSSIIIAKKWRVFAIALSLHCKYANLVVWSMQPNVLVTYLRKSKGLFSFSQSMVEQEHPVRNDRGTFSFQVGCLSVSKHSSFTVLLWKSGSLVYRCLSDNKSLPENLLS